MAGLIPRRFRSAVDAIGYALLGSACVVAVALCLRTAEGPPRAPERARRVAQHIVKQEQALRRRARAEFPGDLWSQDDSFHNLEQGLVRGGARRERVAIGSVLKALDAELRRAPGGEHKHAVAPCKPRPIYD